MALMEGATGETKTRKIEPISLKEGQIYGVNAQELNTHLATKLAMNFNAMCKALYTCF